MADEKKFNTKKTNNKCSNERGLSRCTHAKCSEFGYRCFNFFSEVERKYNWRDDAEICANFAQTSLEFILCAEKSITTYTNYHFGLICFKSINNMKVNGKIDEYDEKIKRTLNICSKTILYGDYSSWPVSKEELMEVFSSIELYELYIDKEEFLNIKSMFNDVIKIYNSEEYHCVEEARKISMDMLLYGLEDSYNSSNYRIENIYNIICAVSGKFNESKVDEIMCLYNDAKKAVFRMDINIRKEATELCLSFMYFFENNDSIYSQIENLFFSTLVFENLFDNELFEEIKLAYAAAVIEVEQNNLIKQLENKSDTRSF